MHNIRPSIHRKETKVLQNYMHCALIEYVPCLIKDSKERKKKETKKKDFYMKIFIWPI